MAPSARRFRQADTIFDAALDLAEGERGAFVERACEGDPALRQQVLRLLRAYERTGDFLGEAAMDVARPLFEATAPAMVPPRAEPLPSAVGPWRPLRELGRGGMGVVYLAIRDDAPQAEPVALKVLRGGAHVGGTTLRRFLAERNILASLEHPHVTQLLETGMTPEGSPWFAMAYCAGGSLAERLARGPLPVADAVRVARQLAGALAAAHAHGIVHRDVKPANVLFDHAGDARLTDFGIAKLVDHDTTQSGTLVGTPAYLAPEQLRGHPVDHRADLWALGVNLYHMLTGVRPFDGPSHAAIMHAVLATEPVPVGRLVHDMPAALQVLVSQLLEKEAANRPESAAAVARALETGRPLPHTGPTRVSSGHTPSRGGSARTTTVVVMPLDGTGQDSDDTALCDGITEELIGALGRVPELRVTARSTAYALRGKGLDARAVGNVLGVAHLLEGTVRRQGSRLRIGMQLVSTRDGSVTWSGRWERELDDLFALQGELAEAIVRALLPAVQDEPTTIRTRVPREPAVYELYLKGRHFLLRRTPPDLRRAAEYFEAALAQDPDFAEAHAGYCETQLFLMFFGNLAPTEGRPRARAAIERALALGSDVAMIHAAYGNLAFFDWCWADGEAALRHALALDAACDDALLYLAQNLQNMARFDESIALARRGLVRDPLSPTLNLALGRAYLHARQPADAVRPLQTALEIVPGLVLAHLQLGYAQLGLGRTADALASFRRAAQANPPLALGPLVHGLAAAGEHDAAQATLARLLAMEERGYVPPFSVASAYAGLGQADEAFAWLERGFAERAAHMITLRVAPAFDAIRGDARFDDLLRRMGLDDASLATARSAG